MPVIRASCLNPAPWSHNSFMILFRCFFSKFWTDQEPSPDLLKLTGAILRWLNTRMQKVNFAPSHGARHAVTLADIQQALDKI